MVLIVTALNASGGCATALSSLTPNNNHQDETGITYKLGSRLGSNAPNNKQAAPVNETGAASTLGWYTILQYSPLQLKGRLQKRCDIPAGAIATDLRRWLAASWVGLRGLGGTRASCPAN